MKWWALAPGRSHGGVGCTLSSLAECLHSVDSEHTNEKGAADRERNLGREDVACQGACVVGVLQRGAGAGKDDAADGTLSGSMLGRALCAAREIHDAAVAAASEDPVSIVGLPSPPKPHAAVVQEPEEPEGVLS